ncbi:MAG: imidazolonepropionase [Oscillospiraceae bacterium]|nr:imidazolonepropionase [Oscillospiraceae bacterium]
MKTIIKNIGVLATPIGKKAKSGKDQGDVLILKDAYILLENETISKIGSGKPVEDLSDYEVIDAKGRLVTPGLIDSHTHLVFGGWREHELALKRRGVPYLEILAQGGGILSTVRKTRAATENELVQKAEDALKEMLSLGVTTCEAKSGYGLDRETELKQLRVIRRLNEGQPVELIPTYLGAHAVPEEYREDREAYLRLMEELIPVIAGEKLAEFCDVFCETGVFTANEAQRILAAAQKCGLKAKMHADEIDAIGGTEAAAALGAVSVEHLIAATDHGIAELAKSGTVAVLLPATSFYLNKPYARARDMVSANVPVAFASDFNPGSCPSLNLQFVMNLGCWKSGLSPEEVLTAVTLNAAAACCRADMIGTIEVGKQADLVIWNAANLEYIFYRFGENLVHSVMKKGKILYTKG